MWKWSRSEYKSTASDPTGITFQLAFTCTKLTIETLQLGVKYVQS